MTHPGDARRHRERRVHEYDVRPGPGETVGDGLRVVAGDARIREQESKEAGPCARYLVQVERAFPPERALRHHGEHPCPGARLQDDVAGTDSGGAYRGVGQAERGRELLQAHLLFRAPGVGGFERGDSFQHGQHGGGTLRSGPGPLSHGPPIALQEEHDGGFRRLVGVLPDPGALGVTSAVCALHGVAQRVLIKRTSRRQDGQQGPGRGK